MRPFIFVLMFITLIVLDAATTVHLHNNFPQGRELNPYIDPGSWMSILLSPVKVAIYLLFLAGLAYSEKHATQLSAWSGSVPNAVLIAYIPVFLIFVKLIAVLNNVMPVMGLSTPVSYVLRAMNGLPGSQSAHYGFFWSAMYLLFALPGIWIIRHVYGNCTPD